MRFSRYHASATTTARRYACPAPRRSISALSEVGERPVALLGGERGAGHQDDGLLGVDELHDCFLRVRASWRRGVGRRRGGALVLLELALPLLPEPHVADHLLELLEILAPAAPRTAGPPADPSGDCRRGSGRCSRAGIGSSASTAAGNLEARDVDVLRVDAELLARDLRGPARQAWPRRRRDRWRSSRDTPARSPSPRCPPARRGSC